MAENRRYEELRRLGGELASNSYSALHIAGEIADIVAHFEIPADERDESVLIGLRGIRDAVARLAPCNRPGFSE